MFLQSPEHFLLPIVKKTDFINRNIGEISKQGQYFVFYSIVQIYGITKINHGRDYDKRFFLLHQRVLLLAKLQ